MISIAILKHIKSRNANYYDALEYLLFQHDEKNGKAIRDDQGRLILREEFYMDGINCEPMAFDTECVKTNKQYHKNNRKADIKSHHYIISFDPKDAAECGLTGKKAQELSFALAKKMFPGHQALVVTHTDGDNHSGNIHTHIVINSVRKYETGQEDYMTQPSDYKAGMKHRSTDKFMEYFKKEVMAMCEREGLHQIDLLSPAPEKITEAEFRAKARGQKKLDQLNRKMIESGIQPAASTFQTQKEFLRHAINKCAASARSFEEFQSLLFEEYNISVISQRGRYRYLHPDRDRRITEKALGTDYGKNYLEGLFMQNEKGLRTGSERSAVHHGKTDYRKDPVAIFHYQSKLRLVVDLQTNVKAMQSEAYARKVKITNLQQMANTLIYIQEHGFDTREDLAAVTLTAQRELDESQKKMRNLNSEMKTLNSQIRYTGQYFASKRVYADFIKSKSKKKFRAAHASELKAYEEARDWLKDFYPDGKILSLKSLKAKKAELQETIRNQKEVIQDCRKRFTELETVSHNADAILNRQAMVTEITYSRSAAQQKSQKERKEKSL